MDKESYITIDEAQEFFDGPSLISQYGYMDYVRAWRIAERLIDENINWIK